METTTLSLEKLAQHPGETAKATVQRIMRNIYQENPSYWPYGLDVDQHGPDGAVYMVREASTNEPAGFVGWQVLEKEEAPGVKVGSYTIGLLPEFRGRGFAEAAVKAIHEKLASTVDEVWAYIMPHNTPSIRLAQRLGIPVSFDGKFTQKQAQQKSAVPWGGIARGLGALGTGVGGAAWMDMVQHPEAQHPFDSSHEPMDRFRANNAGLNGILMAMPWLINPKRQTAAFLGALGGAPGLAYGKDMIVKAIPAIDSVRHTSDDLRHSLPQLTAPSSSSTGPGENWLPTAGMAAGLGIGGLGAGYLISKAIQRHAQNQRSQGQMTVRLPTKDPNDQETSITLPLSAPLSLSQKQQLLLGRDLRRRVRQESTERTWTRGANGKLITHAEARDEDEDSSKEANVEGSSATGRQDPQMPINTVEQFENQRAESETGAELEELKSTHQKLQQENEAMRAQMEFSKQMQKQMEDMRKLKETENSTSSEPLVSNAYPNFNEYLGSRIKGLSGRLNKLTLKSSTVHPGEPPAGPNSSAAAPKPQTPLAPNAPNPSVAQVPAPPPTDGMPNANSPAPAQISKTESSRTRLEGQPDPAVAGPQPYQPAARLPNGRVDLSQPLTDFQKQREISLLKAKQDAAAADSASNTVLSQFGRGAEDIMAPAGEQLEDMANTPVNTQQAYLDARKTKLENRLKVMQSGQDWMGNVNQAIAAHGGEGGATLQDIAPAIGKDLLAAPGRAFNATWNRTFAPGVQKQVTEMQHGGPGGGNSPIPGIISGATGAWDWLANGIREEGVKPLVQGGTNLSNAGADYNDAWTAIHGLGSNLSEASRDGLTIEDIKGQRGQLDQFLSSMGRGLGNHGSGFGRSWQGLGSIATGGVPLGPGLGGNGLAGDAHMTDAQVQEQAGKQMQEISDRIGSLNTNATGASTNHSLFAPGGNPYNPAFVANRYGQAFAPQILQNPDYMARRNFDDPGMQQLADLFMDPSQALGMLGMVNPELAGMVNNTIAPRPTFDRFYGQTGAPANPLTSMIAPSPQQQAWFQQLMQSRNPAGYQFDPSMFHA